MRHPLGIRHLLALAIAAVLITTGCDSTSGSAPGPPVKASAPALHDALPKSIKDSGMLIFAGDSHPPYRTVGPGGKVTGIDKDFQKALGKVLGVQTKITIVGDLPAALQGMLSGRYDAFNGPVKATVKRERKFDTITWMTTRTSYVVPRESSGKVKDAGDLCGSRIAVTKGSVTEKQVAKLSAYCVHNGDQRVRTLPLNNTNATVLAVRSGRADAAGTTQAAAIHIVNKQDALTYVTQTAQQGATKDNLALFVPKDSGLGPVLHKAFQKLFESGKYREIMRKWGLTDVMVDKPVLNIATKNA